MAVGDPLAWHGLRDVLWINPAGRGLKPGLERELLLRGCGDTQLLYQGVQLITVDHG